MSEAKKEKGQKVLHDGVVAWLGDQNKAGFEGDPVWNKFEVRIDPADESEFLVEFELEFKCWVNSKDWPESLLVPTVMKGTLPAKTLVQNACMQQGYIVPRVRDEVRKFTWKEVLVEFQGGKQWNVDLNAKPERRRSAIDKQKIMVTEFLTRSGKTEEEVKAIVSDAARYQKVIDYLAAQEVPEF